MQTKPYFPLPPATICTSPSTECEWHASSITESATKPRSLFEPAAAAAMSGGAILLQGYFVALRSPRRGSHQREYVATFYL